MPALLTIAAFGASVLAAGPAAVGGLALAVWVRGRMPPPQVGYDAIIVAGCAVLPDGTASPSLRRRAAHGAALWHEGWSPLLVVSGGPMHGTTEADAAATVARELGVPDNAIVLERHARTTAENARLSADLPQLGPDCRVLVVTDDWHLVRALRLFRRHFKTAHGSGARAPFRSAVKGSLSEAPKLLLGWILRW